MQIISYVLPPGIEYTMRNCSTLRAQLASLATVVALTGCTTATVASLPSLSTGVDNLSAPRSSGEAVPLPLLVPVRGIMAGVIDFSAYGVFQAATSSKLLTEEQWSSAGLAAVNLIAASTLITLPSSQPQDAEWIADPEWLRKAADMQNASVLVGVAINRQDGPGLLKTANLLADSCQSCHDRFKPDLPKTDLSQFASK